MLAPHFRRPGGAVWSKRSRCGISPLNRRMNGSAYRTLSTLRFGGDLARGPDLTIIDAAYGDSCHPGLGHDIDVAHLEERRRLPTIS